MTKTCLVPDCGRDPFSRGVCPRHYTAIYDFVKKGKATWEQLEKAGKVLAPRPAGRKSQIAKYLEVEA